MNREDIIRLAREAGCIEPAIPDWVIRTCALVASAEREACAGLRKEVALQGKHTVEYEEGFWDGLEKYEDLIKARGLT